MVTEEIICSVLKRNQCKSDTVTSAVEKVILKSLAIIHRSFQAEDSYSLFIK